MSWLIGKDFDAGRDWVQEEKGTTEDEMAVWHHWHDRRESEWTPGVGDGQGGLACCYSWGRKVLDTTERLNWTEFFVLAFTILYKCKWNINNFLILIILILFSWPLALAKTFRTPLDKSGDKLHSCSLPFDGNNFKIFAIKCGLPLRIIL